MIALTDEIIIPSVFGGLDENFEYLQSMSNLFSFISTLFHVQFIKADYYGK